MRRTTRRSGRQGARAGSGCCPRCGSPLAWRVCLTCRDEGDRARVEALAAKVMRIAAGDGKVTS